MSESAKYEAYKKKLQGVCEENNLVFRLRRDKYPITLTIRPISGLEEQMCMLEAIEEKGYTSPDAAIVFSVKDGALTYKTSQTFTISDALFSKIKNLFKNIHYCWLQFFFRDIIEKGVLTERTMPTIDDGGDEFSVEDDAENLAPLVDEMDDSVLDEEPAAADEQNFGDEEHQMLLHQAADLVRSEGTASLALLQRRLSIGRAKAGRLMADLEDRGVVGPQNGFAPREVLSSDALPSDADTPLPAHTIEK